MDLRSESYMDSMTAGTSSKVAPNDAVLDIPDQPVAAADKLPAGDVEEAEEEDVEPVTFSQLYRFANCSDKFQLFLGILGSIGMGVLQPCTIVFFGDAFDGLGTPSGFGSANDTAAMEAMMTPSFMAAATDAYIADTGEAGATFGDPGMINILDGTGWLMNASNTMSVFADIAISNGMDAASAEATADGLASLNMTDPSCVDTQWMMESLDNIQTFMNYSNQTGVDGMYSPEALKDLYSMMLKLLYLALAMFPFGFSSFYFLSWTAQKQGTIIRTKYLEALLRQEVGWYDSKMSGALTSQISSQVNTIQGAMSDKLGNCIRFLVCFIASFTIAFYYAWQMTLVLLAAVPLLGAAGLFIMKLMGSATGQTEKKYAKAGGIADEALTLIKTVVAFGNVEREVKRYDDCLEFAQKKGVTAAKGNGFGIGMLWCIIFWLYALGFWYGSRQMRIGILNPSDVLIAFFSVFTGAMGIGQSAASIAAFAAGKAAAARVYKIIDRVSEIDSLSETGAKPTKVVGDITFKKVNFAYPSRPDEPVFVDLDLEIRNNTNVGIVGESGCGKSTFVNMVERFYDPQSGCVEMDGTNIQELNVQWLRNQIAYVQQQPVLFPVSVFENIASGKTGASKADVVAAAKQANAHDFIEEMPEGYDTNVGASGSQLSGGQKQRIAVARALIGQPKILLLDEATSALDTISEKIVYQSLRDTAVGRTTITIAHRLSTVKHCDEIIVLGMDHTIKERGSHDELMALEGFYAAMSYAQSLADSQGRTGADADMGESKLEAAAADSVILGVGSETDGETKGDDTKKKKDVGDEEADKENEFDKLLPDMKVSETRYLFKFMNTSEWAQTQAGIFMSAIVGSLTPGYAAMFAVVLNELIFKCNDASMIDMYCAIYFGLGFASVIFYTAQIGLLGYVGESVTRRIRSRSMEELLKQKVQFFDMPGNGKAILTSRLAGDAAKVKALIIDRIPIILSLLVSVVGGIAIAMAYCWRVALVVLSMFPVIGVASALQMKAMAGTSTDGEYETSGEFGNQAVENIRTVLAMGKVKEYLDIYKGHLADASAKHRDIAIKGGLGNGFNEMLITGSFAAVFAYGAHVMSTGQCSFLEFMIAQSETMFPIMFSGQLVTMLPDVTATKRSIKRIHAILGPDGKGYAPTVAPGTAKPAIKGHIELKNVHFTYPSRPDAPVLEGLSLTIEAGQTVALVGASGCGKSTIFALIEQFYVPSQGQILIDGLPVTEFDTAFLRSQMGYVAQEPQLFSMTVGQNVSYGLTTDPEHERIVAACKRSNAHTFVSQAKEQYDTLVGEKGLKLSGGQRQRIAIARGLIREDDIKILLLDEATSALDTKSEELVQKELDEMCKGRTTLVIAHRLSTVQNADRIIVFDNGKIIEDGTHQSLLALEGAYTKMCQTQNLGVAK